ncbi:hypothetical protein [Gimesia sp.]|uniref:hypothetical protein n=1 Tax=Gimesia sp. TaxID=2024833 RepID=UPI003A927CF6
MNTQVDENTFRLVGADAIKSIDTLSGTTCKKLRVTGLKQESFDYLIDVYGHQFEEIDFFKCPLVGDLSGLESLDGIKSISFYWNQLADRLWDLSKNKSLKSITLDDFTKLHSLEDLVSSESIIDVSFGDRIWSTLILDSLEPLARIRNLRKLSFSAKKIIDFRISPLAEIPKLEELDFPTNLFPTEKVAWLTARIGKKVTSSVLAPYRIFSKPISSGEKQIDTFVIGKRKPSLDARLDAKKIEKYVEKFNHLTEYFIQNPSEAEPV